MLRRLYFKHVHHNLHHQVQTNENEVFYHKPKTTTNTTASNEDEYNYNTSNEDEYNTSNEDEYEYDSSEDGTTAGSAGSEHSIDEKFYAMEMQMVFFDKRFQTD